MNNKFVQKFYNTNINTIVAGFIFIADFISFLLDFKNNYNFSSFCNLDRLVFYGLIFCLFLDSFLWGEKEFLVMQIAKIICTVITGKYQYSFFSSIFFYSLSFYYYNRNWLSNKEGKFLFVIENLFVCAFLTIFCLQKNIVVSMILLFGNIIFIFPIFLLQIIYPHVICKQYPESRFDFFLQEINQIPITLVGWFFPYCLLASIFLCNFVFNIMLICFTLFSLFIEQLSLYQLDSCVSLNIYKYEILKISIILLLLLTGEQSGLIDFF